MKITLYKMGKIIGQTQEWTIEVVGNKYRTIEGLVGGKLTTNAWTECFGKNVGKVNETSPEHQAILEAESKAQKKMDKGYAASIEGMEVHLEPTLAHVFEKYEKVVSYPVLTSPKLDGVRCIANKDGLFTRNGKPIVSCPHIMDELKSFFESFPNAVLDGELYNHSLYDDFDKVISLTRQLKPTEEDLQKSADLIQYHVFDIQNPVSYIQRLEDLISSFSQTSRIVVVSQLWADSYEDVLRITKNYISAGYEGSIVRWNLDAPYTYGRTKYLLKVKFMEDDEFEVVDILEGKGKRQGTVGKWVVRLKSGEINEAGPTGTDAQNALIFSKKEKYIGKMATIQYQGYTPKGKLRFPVYKAIRDDY